MHCDSIELPSTPSQGRVEFETIDSAKAAIDKYDGVDMGLGNVLKLEAL